MARYTDVFDGIPGGFRPPGGMDPNYRDGYHGMRMDGRPDQAAYGRYRFRHPDDFAAEGGFGGRYDGIYGGRAGRGALDYRREWQDGAVRHPRYDREFLRDFNADSPALRRRRDERGYDGEMRPGQPDGVPGLTHWGYDPRYTNRGLSSSGYGEGWARGPMRGAR